MERPQLEQRLVCTECGAVSDEQAEGWQARLAGGVVDGYDCGELGVGVYCSDCAAGEFGRQ